MELYLSDHPLERAPAGRRAHANCATWRDELGVTQTSVRAAARRHRGQPKDESNPYFTFDPGAVHRLLALRARVR